MKPPATIHRTVLAASVVWLAAGGAASAHPHVWIDATAVFHFDSRQRLTAVETRWLFDDMFSEYEVEGRDADGDGRLSVQELQPLADETVERLVPWRYFSFLEAGEKNVALGPPSVRRMRFEGGRLDLTMTLPLPEPLEVKGATVRFAMYDPFYYIEIVPLIENPVRLSGHVPDGCRVDLDRIENRAGAVVPDSVAMAEDPDPQRPESSLGAVFADWVVLACKVAS